MTKLHIVIALVICLCTAKIYAQSENPHFSSIILQPTIAYVKTNGTSQRMARLLFKNGKSYEATNAQVSFNGQTTNVPIPASKDGISVFELPLPGNKTNISMQAVVSIYSNNQTYTARCIVEPARDNWTVYVLPHSHVDIGYTNTQAKVLKLHMDNIDEAIDLAAKTANYPVEARFKWTTEAIWVVDNYLKQADNAKAARFWDAVKKGWISLDGAYGNINTSMTDSYQLMQMFSRSRQLAAEHGIKIQTMFQGDVPGASWGLAAQSEETGIRYFLSGPNASDRIGNLAKWQDKPFYWMSPDGTQKILFWQCQPYSLGYGLKGTKIPNFFNVEDPKPYYTGHPSENFLNPYIFQYLAGLEQSSFPYDMTILTWAMSDNAPIDPELPDAVKLWNGHYSSPKLVITGVSQFFNDFEQKYKENIPHFSGDYTEYWTDGVSSAAKETALSRETSDKLKQADALWAIRNMAAYPVAKVSEAWTNLLLYNEHTWGAYNSVDEPDNEKVKSEWNVKRGYVINADKQVNELMNKVLSPSVPQQQAVDVYNTLSWSRSGIVYLSPALSAGGDEVKNDAGQKIPSQRLSTGELAFVATNVAPFSKRTYTIHAGKAYSTTSARVTANSLDNGIYHINIDEKTGDISKLVKNEPAKNIVIVDSTGFNKYLYMPGDSIQNLETSSEATIAIKENGPLVVSVLIKSNAPGANGLTREIKLTEGVDNVEIINTIDKKAIRTKESVHFAFPFNVPYAQVRYSIPWGSVTAETDQLPNANKNWYTMQRWVDVSNALYGVTWSSPDAPLFEIGKITTADLLGGLHLSPQWLTFTPQSSKIYSWVMNNLWHTNFRVEQDEGQTTFHYFFQVHDKGFNSLTANKAGLNNHQPLIAAAASADKRSHLFFNIKGTDIYVEEIKPANDGHGFIGQIVSCSDAVSKVSISAITVSAVKVWRSNLLEEKVSPLGNNFTIPAKGVITVRIEQ